jgi:hypothetical protein
MNGLVFGALIISAGIALYFATAGLRKRASNKVGSAELGPVEAD